jgi:multidrug efflux pump subunit AcrB
MNDTLSDVFDVEPMQNGKLVVVDQSPNTKAPVNEKIESDYDKTRGNLYALLQSGQDALMHALEVAKQSEHPRAFEVVGNLMKQLADINEQLMKLHETKRKLDVPINKSGDESSPTKQVTNNNAIFVGSTSELSKMIQNMNKGE